MITIKRSSVEVVALQDYPALVLWGAGPDENMTKQEWRLKDRILAGLREGIYSEEGLISLLSNHYDYEVIIS